MNGTKVLIDAAIGSPRRKARNIAVSELCYKDAVTALEYVAKNSEYPDTRMSVTRFLYVMEALAALKRISRTSRFSDVKGYAKRLVEDYEFGESTQIAEIDLDEMEHH